MSTSQQQLSERLTLSATLIAGLERDHAGIVAATESSNADDEHDPEGATIAFERQQVSALLQQARRQRADLERALDQLAQGTYGVCERCGGQIPAERLTARPGARTCLPCAT